MYLFGMYTAFPWADPGDAHFFCLFGTSLSIPGFNVPLAKTIGASFYNINIKNKIKRWVIFICEKFKTNIFSCLRSDLLTPKTSVSRSII